MTRGAIRAASTPGSSPIWVSVNTMVETANARPTVTSASYWRWMFSVLSSTKPATPPSAAATATPAHDPPSSTASPPDSSTYAATRWDGE